MPGIVSTDLLVCINGVPVIGLLQAVFHATNHFSADTFSLTFGIGKQTPSLTYWNALSSGYVEVFDTGSSVTDSPILISGMIDTLGVDLIRGLVTIEGRDLSASLVDSYRQADFVNQTASEIVRAIGGYHGLESAVASTSGYIGRYYEDGYTRLSTGQFSRLRSDWDLIVELARENKFDVFVLARTLHFQRSPSSFNTFVLITPEQVLSLHIEVEKAVANTTTTKVQSWNSQHMAGYTGISTNSATQVPPISPSTATQPYLFSVTNLTSDQADSTARRYDDEVSRLATRLVFNGHWNSDISPRTGIFLSGTGTNWDGTYRVESVERHFNARTGSTQTVHAVPITSKPQTII
jgi:phage protein D